MNLALRRVKVYAQVGSLASLVLAIGWVLFKNRKNEVAFWFFGLTDPAKELNVVWLLVWTASSTLVVARVFWFARGLWRNFRELRHAERAASEVETQRRRAADLEARQRELDEKLRAIQEKSEDMGEKTPDEPSADQEIDT